MRITAGEIQADISELMAEPYKIAELPLDIETPFYRRLGSAISQDVHVWTVNSLATSTSRSVTKTHEVLLSDQLTSKLLDGWIVDPVKSIGGDEAVGEIGRSSTELATIHQESNIDAWMHVLAIPEDQQNRLTAVTGISEEEMCIGGVARASLFGRSIADQYVSLSNKLVEFKSKHAVNGLTAPETVQRLIKSDLQPLESLDWSQLDDSIDVVKLGQTLLSSIDGSLSDTLQIKNSISAWESLGLDIRRLITYEARERGAKKINEQLIVSDFANVMCGLRQLREVGPDQNNKDAYTKAMLIENSSLTNLFMMVQDEFREDRVEACFTDKTHAVRGVLLLKKYMLIVSPSPISGYNWVQLSVID